MKAIALYNRKGGVGKTTAAVHLAHLSARAGRATLLWDLDPQAAASWMFRVRLGAAERPKRWLRERAELGNAIRGSDFAGLDVLPADLAVAALEGALRREAEPERALADLLAELGARYERIVLDCPPAASLLARCVSSAVHALVVPTIPTPLSLRTLAALHAELKPRRREGLLVLPFFSMVDARKAIHRRVIAFARAEGLGFLATEIASSAQVESAAGRREPLTAKDASPAAAAFESLHREVEERLAAPGSPPKLGASRLGRFLHEFRDDGPRETDGTLAPRRRSHPRANVESHRESSGSSPAV